MTALVGKCKVVQLLEAYEIFPGKCRRDTSSSKITNDNYFIYEVR